jgi:ribonuclease BN (tRNA processing enzyme)
MIVRMLTTTMFLFLMLGTSCGASGQVTVQVLGSGGPLVKADRASASYLVWVDGHARILVDIGGGAFLRFGEADAKVDDLSLIAISHLHPDHVSDLPALLWRNTPKGTRSEPLRIAGPSGNDTAPGFDAFLSRLFDGKSGAFQVLGGTLGGSEEGAPLDIKVIDVARAESSPALVLDRAGLRVTALSVPHANMPSLAYRVDTAGTSIVFGSDQTGANPKFADFARNADLLILHMPLAPGASNAFHAAPDVVGRMAHAAAARRLVVSHIGQFNIDAALAEVRKHYEGPITVAEDLQCTSAR